MADTWKVEDIHKVRSSIKTMDLSNVHIVTCISNPARFSVRYSIYKQWAAEIMKAGLNLTTVELALGDRPFEVPDASATHVVRLRSEEELWHKENMLNIGIANVCQRDPNAKYFCWIDADTFPTKPWREWIEETVQLLQRYHFVQMFEYAQWLDAEDNPFGAPGKSIIGNYYRSGFQAVQRGGSFGFYGQHSRSGLAWAATREALDAVGGLIDWGILGSADWYMAFGLMHEMEKSLPVVDGKTLSKDYIDECMQWEARCRRHIRKDIGYCKGLVYHRHHGSITERRYYERNGILIKNQFQPNIDLKKDSQGVLMLEDSEQRQIVMRDEIRMYMSERNEDSLNT